MTYNKKIFIKHVKEHSINNLCSKCNKPIKSYNNKDINAFSTSNKYDNVTSFYNKKLVDNSVYNRISYHLKILNFCLNDSNINVNSYVCSLLAMLNNNYLKLYDKIINIFNNLSYETNLNTCKFIDNNIKCNKSTIDIHDLNIIEDFNNNASFDTENN